MGRIKRPAPRWWGEVSDHYLRALARRNCRPNTLIAYGCELADFGAWLLEERVRSLTELRRPHIESWQDELRTRKAVSTQGVAATAMRGFLKWAADQELELSSPTLWLRVATPRVPPPLPRPIPLGELAVIQQALADPDPRQLWRLRTRALFWLMYSSGARISEALSLMRGSFDGDAAVVIQKGGRKHTLLISKRAQGAIAEYVAARTDRLPNLFASLETSSRESPLRKREVQEGWDLLAAGLEVTRFTSHQLRHSCATAILRDTGDVALAAKHVGHRTLQAINGYAEVAIDKRREAVALLDAQLVG